MPSSQTLLGACGFMATAFSRSSARKRRLLHTAKPWWHSCHSFAATPNRFEAQARGTWFDLQRALKPGIPVPAGVEEAEQALRDLGILSD